MLFKADNGFITVKTHSFQRIDNHFSGPSLFSKTTFPIIYFYGWQGWKWIEIKLGPMCCDELPKRFTQIKFELAVNNKSPRELIAVHHLKTTVFLLCSRTDWQKAASLFLSLSFRLQFTNKRIGCGSFLCEYIYWHCPEKER